MAKSKKTWKQWEDDFLREHVANMTASEIAAALKRRILSPEEWLRSLASYLGRTIRDFGDQLDMRFEEGDD